MKNVGWTTAYLITPVYNRPGGKKTNIKLLLWDPQIFFWKGLIFGLNFH